MPCAPRPRSLTAAAHEQSGVRLAERDRADAAADRVVEDRPSRSRRRGRDRARVQTVAARRGGRRRSRRARRSRDTARPGVARRRTAHSDQQRKRRDRVTRSLSGWWCDERVGGGANARQRVVGRVTDRRQVAHLASRPRPRLPIEMKSDAGSREGALERRRSVMLEPEIAEQVVNRAGAQTPACRRAEDRTPRARSARTGSSSKRLRSRGRSCAAAARARSRAARRRRARTSRRRGCLRARAQPAMSRAIPSARAASAASIGAGSTDQARICRS